MKKIKEKILFWLGSGCVGASSKAMAFAVIDIDIKDNSHPLDPADLNRCLLFLAVVPEARLHLDKVAKLSKTWKVMIKNWDKLESLFLDEAGLDWSKAESAPKTYEFVKKLRKVN